MVDLLALKARSSGGEHYPDTVGVKGSNPFVPTSQIRDLAGWLSPFSFLSPFLMKKGISIVIPTYNGGRIFAECLQKIKRQKYAGEIQLIVIDSGSNDGTPDLAENVGAIVKRIDHKEFNHAKTRNTLP